MNNVGLDTTLCCGCPRCCSVWLVVVWGAKAKAVDKAMMAKREDVAVWNFMIVWIDCFTTIKREVVVGGKRSDCSKMAATRKRSSSSVSNEVVQTTSYHWNYVSDYFLTCSSCKVRKETVVALLARSDHRSRWRWSIDRQRAAHDESTMV